MILQRMRVLLALMVPYMMKKDKFVFTVQKELIIFINKELVHLVRLEHIIIFRLMLVFHAPIRHTMMIKKIIA